MQPESVRIQTTKPTLKVEPELLNALKRQSADNSVLETQIDSSDSMPDVSYFPLI